MKFSIRLSIIALFASLLISIGIIITIIQYSSAHKVLMQSTETIFKNSSLQTETFIENIFAPAKQRTIINTGILKDKLVLPDSHVQFLKFLLLTLTDLPNNSVAGWSDQNGNLHVLERSENNTFYSTLILCQNNLCNAEKTHVDGFGGTLEQPQLGSWDESTFKIISGNIAPYDPRIRPWYKLAVAKHQTTMSEIYQSISFSGPSFTAITMATPIYDNTGALLGVFNIDTKLETLSKKITNIHVSNNSFIFIFDDKNTIVATSTAAENLEFPWVKTAFNLYQQNHQRTFLFNFDHKQYLAFYEKLTPLEEGNWSLGIVLPVNDIIGNLNQQLLISLVITCGVLLLGIILIWFVSSGISKPIARLANETKLIRNLDLSAQKPVASRIKEIIYMQHALSTMRQSLISFARYVPITLIKNLIASGNTAHVGGTSKKITVLFIDIQGFTSISEKMSPQALMAYLSEYFEVATKIILDNNGTVDKYIGDAVMAFWGAPLDDNKHALHACQSAVMIKESLARVQPQTKIRIGINTGTAIIGNVGSQDRLSYTAIGDSVNLANRLEGLNKFYKTTTIVSSSTFQIVKKQFSFRLLDNVAVRGKNIGSYIYELLQEPYKYSASFNEAFASYQKGDWQQALKLFTKFGKTFPRNYLAQIYIERCKKFAENPPKKWDGVWRFE